MSDFCPPSVNLSVLSLSFATQFCLCLNQSNYQYIHEGVANSLISQLSTLFECFVDAEDWHSCKFFNAITGWRFESERRNPTGEYGGKSTYMRLHGNERLRFYIEYISMYLTGTTEHNSSHIKGVAPCRSSAKKQNDITSPARSIRRGQSLCTTLMTCSYSSLRIRSSSTSSWR